MIVIFFISFLPSSFLIYAIKNETLGGLYSIDLDDLAEQKSLPINAERPTPKIKRIFTNGTVLAFKVDPINSRIFVMINKANNQTEIIAVPYSG